MRNPGASWLVRSRIRLERVRRKAGAIDEVRSDGVVLPGETDFSRIRNTGRPDDDRAATVFDRCFCPLELAVRSP
jgi:hypothetical protein